MRNKNKQTHIWPQYINSKRTLAQGRKISLDDAVSDPSIKEMEKALTRLNLEFETIPEHRYPGEWYEKSGEILVDYQGNKNELLRNISEKIKERRK